MTYPSNIFDMESYVPEPPGLLQAVVEFFINKVSELVLSSCFAKLTFPLKRLTLMQYTKIAWGCVFANAVFSLEI